MAEEEKIEDLLSSLAKRTEEEVSPHLVESIKQQIPSRLNSHKPGMETINIVINLRVSRLAAAAVIVISVILWASLMGSGESVDDGLYQDSKLLISYWFGGESKKDLLASKSRYEYLVGKGKEVAYYGENIKTGDSNAVLMHWRLSDGNYRVVFGDLREETILAEDLISLQSKMLEKKTK